ncbi:DUF1877 family protein [Kitasatospora sp. NPDC091335]|uniref:DUF1877 family protein n=1 Tax=Kitasatospora sp. NPDC091335 TaxID=3364085 RepID=UPI00380495D5
MSVDFFWRRVDGGLLDELSPGELFDLVPDWFDSEFGPQHQAGTVLAVESNGYLMHVALMEAVGGAGPDLRTAQLPVFAGEERVIADEETTIRVLRPDEVRAASAFLERVGVDDLVSTVGAALAEKVADLGFATPWSEEWAGHLTADLRALKDFYAGAAAAGDAMVKFESA